MPESVIIGQSSQQFSDSPEEIALDVKGAFNMLPPEGTPNSIAWSEARPGSAVRAIVEKQAGLRDWYVVDAPRGDTVITVHPDNEILEDGFIHVLDAFTGNRRGNFAARGVVWVKYRTPAGNLVAHVSTHWITSYDLDTNPGAEDRREVWHKQQTEAIIKQALFLAKGLDVVFVSGDTNVDERKDLGSDPDAPHAMFSRAGFTSIYDEMRHYPSTHGNKVLDIVYSFNGDKRVAPLFVSVYKKGRKSDHGLVITKWNIEDLVIKPPTCPTCGQPLPPQS